MNRGKNIGMCRISTCKIVHRNSPSIYFGYFFEREVIINSDEYCTEPRVKSGIEDAFSKVLESLRARDLLILHSTNKKSREEFPDYLKKKLRIILCGDEKLLEKKWQFIKIKKLLINIKILTFNDLLLIINFIKQKNNRDEVLLSQLDVVIMIPEVIKEDKKSVSVSLIDRIRNCYLAGGLQFSRCEDFNDEEIEEGIRLAKTRTRALDRARTNAETLNKALDRYCAQLANRICNQILPN